MNQEARASKTQTTSRWCARLRRVTRAVLVLLAVVLLIGWWQVLRIVEHDHWPLPEDAVTAAQAMQMTSDFIADDNTNRGDLAIAFAPSTASEVDLYLDGSSFFPAMMADIEAAQHSIHIIMFAISPGKIGDALVDLLIQKVGEGVEVRLVTDRQGSKPFTRNREMFDRLAAGGVQVVLNDTWPIQATGVLPDRDRDWRQDEVGRADHRKMMVIDGRIGWVGGAGFEDHFEGGTWLDTFVRAQGDVVLQLQAVFCTSFDVYGGVLPADLTPYFPLQENPGHIKTTVLQNIPGGFAPATQASRAIIDSAEVRVDVLNPYFTDASMIDRVVDAGQRGVDVRVATSRDSNNVPGAWAFRRHYQRMFDAGVGVYEVPGVIHAKVTVADDAVIIGSLNYDAWSLYRNLEISLLFEDAETANRVVAEIIEPVLAQSETPIAPEGWREQIPAHFWWWTRYFL
ncbi:MAG: phosphatidylserine/phosphatidylglycerophosphate/cardiolipin synthase family protein [Thermomicrobiales bacterium]|nr:phosphatidylserine/phosphatidylglycerophosphate/cardiolipin synthase family protein [Thermomicrobiales bacterium]